MTTRTLADNGDIIRLMASIVTAIGMLILVPLTSWGLLSIVSLGERTASLEAWRGEGRRYTDVDAEKDFGVVLRLIELNEEGIQRNEAEIRLIRKK